MKKKDLKQKSPVTLRWRELRNGNKSLYLDIYTGDENPRIREFLKMYIVPERSAAAKINNENIMRAAEAIRSQRILDIANGKANIKASKKESGITLVDWLKTYAEYKGECGNLEMQRQTNRITQIVIDFKDEKYLLKNIDKQFILDFISYLNKIYKNSKGDKLSKKTISNYTNILNCAINNAVQKGLLAVNPYTLLEKAEKPKAPESQRSYLSIEEVQKLISTNCPNPKVKNAFLFSVYCGLRISDIKLLKWGNIVTENGETKITTIMKKTKNSIVIPLSKSALRWLPEKKEQCKNDPVFVLPGLANINVVLKKWAKDAEITKQVTYHVSRHTFATMLLTLGADLYTTSKLLGHTDISTTQIYAKIVDQKKSEAVNLVDNIFK